MASTAQPDSPEQGVEIPNEETAIAKGRKPRKGSTVRADTGAGDDGVKLYLSADVRFRLRMLAFQKGKKISATANELLDKHLPKWELKRSE